MAEDLKSKLAAIKERKTEKARLAEEQQKVEIARAEAESREKRGAELQEKATQLETEIAQVEGPALAAQQEAQEMLDEGDLDEEDRSAIEGVIAEAQQTIDDLSTTREELAQVRAEINQLSAETEEGSTVDQELSDEKPSEAPPEQPVVAPATAERAGESHEFSETEGESEEFYGAEQIKEFLSGYSLDDPDSVHSLIHDLNDKISADLKARVTEDGLEELKKAYDQIIKDDQLVVEIDKRAEKYSGVEQMPIFESFISDIEKYLKMRNDKEYVPTQVDDILENPSLGFGYSGSFVRIEKLADDCSHIPGATEALVDKLGSRLIDIVKSVRDERQETENMIAEQDGREPRRRKFLKRREFEGLANIARVVESEDKEKADKYHEFILNAIADDLEGSDPAEIRKNLVRVGDNRSVYTELTMLFNRMDAGEEIPDNVERALLRVIPILEANDKESLREGEEASEFLTDKFIKAKTGGSFKEDGGDETLGKIRVYLDSLKEKSL